MKTSKQWIVFLSILVVVAFAWGFYQSADGGTATATVENDRQRAFYDLVDSVEKMSVLSSKALVSTGDSNRAKLYAQLNTESYVAQENLSQLPVAHEALTRTQSFINQMGDFSYSLIGNAARGESLTEDQYNTMAGLHEEVRQVADALHNLANADEDPFFWKAIKASTKKLDGGDLATSGLANSSFGEVNSTLSDVPALIYDGPFSDHLESRGPVELPGEETGWDNAINVAKGLFGEEGTYERLGKSSAHAGIGVLNIAVTMPGGEDVGGWLDVTQKGSYPVQFTADSSGAKASISPEDGVNIAAEFLAMTPYQSMTAVYYLTEDAVLTVNFVYTENGILYYPDMVKVSVDLANGNIVGMDAINYLTSHFKDRSFSTLTITEEAAAANLTTSMTPASLQKNVIPLQNGEESLSYEYRFDGETQSWLVYINAETGVEDDVLGLYTTENGTFTM